jgi:hypothetical protein
MKVSLAGASSSASTRNRLARLAGRASLDLAFVAHGGRDQQSPNRPRVTGFRSSEIGSDHIESGTMKNPEP